MTIEEFFKENQPEIKWWLRSLNQKPIPIFVYQNYDGYISGLAYWPCEDVLDMHSHIDEDRLFNSYELAELSRKQQVVKEYDL